MVYQNIALKQFYSRIYSQTLSSSYYLLAIGCSEGRLAIYDVSDLINLSGETSREKLKKSLVNINAHNDSIYALASTPELCITSSSGVIAGWYWKDFRKGKDKPHWTISLDCDQANFGTPEINSLAFDSDRNILLAACGDWKTRAFDLETGKQTLALEGHENYVHDVVIWGSQIGTAGEDGKVLIWDLRAGKEPKIKIHPHTNNQLKRPSIGKFVTSLDIEKEWLVCGGGPKAGLFHLRSLALATELPPNDSVIHVSHFTRQGSQRGNIALAGGMQSLFLCSMSGDVTAEIPTSSSCVYTVNIASNPIKLMTVGGSGPTLDVCLNLNYRDHTVAVC